MTIMERYRRLSHWLAGDQRVSVIDLDPLLTEISPEAHSGENDLEYDPEFTALEEKIRKITESHDDQFGDTDKREDKPPKWGEIQTDALELLTRTHDLRLGLFLTQALLQTKGVMGLCDGLNLLLGFIERYWETLYPQLDPDDNHDPTYRISILMNLCDREMIVGPLIGTTLCAIPALGPLSLRGVRIASGQITGSEEEKRSALSLPAIEAALIDCDIGELQTTREALDTSLQSLTGMETLLTDMVGAANAPNFKEVRDVLEEMHHFLSEHTAKHSPKAPSAEEQGPENDNLEVSSEPRTAESIPSAAVKPMETISDRQDVIRILEKICGYYERNEPASPVPLLLKRAIRLVEKNFMEIIQDLAPDSVSQIQTISGAPEEES